MQDGALFIALQLVRVGFYNYLKSRSVFVFTLYNKKRQKKVCVSGEYVEYVAQRQSYFSSTEAVADLKMILR